MSSVQFTARAFAGNIGAPLGVEDSIWVSGPSDDVVNRHDEEHEEADEPFRVVLKAEEESQLRTHRYVLLLRVQLYFP